MTARRQVRALIVDQHLLVSECLALELSVRGLRAEVCHDLRPEAVLDHARTQDSDVVLLDLHLGTVVGDGTQLVAPLTEQGHQVLVVSADEDPTRLGGALAAGAVGYVAKTESVEQLVTTAVAAGRGEPVIEPQVRDDLVLLHRASLADHRLTRGESEVLASLARGESISRIATQRTVSEDTVRSQVQAILRKLGVASPPEAVARVVTVPGPTRQ